MHDAIPVLASYSTAMGLWVLVFMRRPGREAESVGYWLRLPLAPVLDLGGYVRKRLRS